MDRSDFLFRQFSERLPYEPTDCQESLLRDIAVFLTSDDGDILVVDGHAGTGKTTALSAVIGALDSMKLKTVLLAPTGRAAKVFSKMSGRPASTVHKHIYRQKSVGEDGMGQFSLAPNKASDTLFIVDEVSLVGIDDPMRTGGAAFGSGNLLGDLVEFVRRGNGCRLILMGDSAQLPPVGLEESPALDSGFMEAFGGVGWSRLTTVVRQEAGSGILRNATLLRGLLSTMNGDYGASGELKLNLRDCADVVRVSGGELIDAIASAYSDYGEDDTIVLCRSNKRAIRYNLGIRAQVLYREERLVRGDKLMIVKNCYQFVDDVEGMDYIANGDMAKLVSIRNFEDRYGLHFADAVLSFPDYDDIELRAKVCLDTLGSESASLTREQQDMLWRGVSEDYASLSTKKARYEAVREDPYYNALQLKYADAITCHKSQGGQWGCVFIDCPFWLEEQTPDDIKWLYTAITRAVEKVYLVNFNDRFFI